MAGWPKPGHSQDHERAWKSKTDLRFTVERVTGIEPRTISLGICAVRARHVA